MPAAGFPPPPFPQPGAQPRADHAADTGAAYLTRPAGVPLRVTRDGHCFIVQHVDGRIGSRWQMRLDHGRLSLSLQSSADSGHAHQQQLHAAIEAVFSHHPGTPALTLDVEAHWLRPLAEAGIVEFDGAQALVPRDAFWQWPAQWLADPRAPSPLCYTISQGRRHPKRRPKPVGEVYRRHIPWLGQSFSLRSVSLEDDLPRFNRWMNDPVVARFWQEEGDLAKHRSYLDTIAQDPHVISLIGCFDDQPFAYFEVYWAKEDRIAPFCDALDHDRGWHVLIGEPHFRGRPYLTAWMPSVSHYLLLDDCRTQRVVIEPRADNDKMIKSLARCGYALLKEFDFPHKRAMLGMLLRERFFGEALWVPSST